MSEIPVPRAIALFFAARGCDQTGRQSVRAVVTVLLRWRDVGGCAASWGTKPLHAHPAAPAARSSSWVGGDRTLPTGGGGSPGCGCRQLSSCRLPPGDSQVGFLAHPPAPAPSWPRGSVSSQGPGLGGATPCDPLSVTGHP